VFGNMTMTGKGEWFIDSVNTRTGEQTSLTAKGVEFGGRLDVQPWAYGACRLAAGGCLML
jgi:hypothetical protein